MENGCYPWANSVPVDPDQLAHPSFKLPKKQKDTAMRQNQVFFLNFK
jgi:hypothetical protein